MKFLRKKLPFVLFLLPLFFLVIILPTKTFAFDLLPIDVTPAYKVLSDTTSPGMGKSVADVWHALLNLVNGFVIIVIIVVAFAEILRLNINTYGVKKMLPTLIFAVIAANFSFLFCRLMVDFANIVMAGIIHGTSGTALTDVMNGGKSGGWANPNNTAFDGMSTSGGGGTVFWFGIVQLLLIASGVIIYILAFLFFIRLWLIYFLVALTPLAFMATALPQTKSLFNQWWSNFFKWTFMPVVSVFWIWLGAQWLSTMGSNMGWFLQILFGGVCFYLAITTPFKMGGAIMNTWGGIGKKVWGKTGGAAWNATGGAIGKGIKTGVNNYWDTQKGHIVRRMEGTGLGQRYSAIRDRGKVNQELSKTMLEKQRGDSYRRQALQKLYSKSPAEWDRVSKDAHGRLKKLVGNGVNEEYANPSYKDAYSIPKLEGNVIKNTRGGIASVYDFNNPSNLVLTATQRSAYNADGGLNLFEQSAASAKELIRRSKMKSHRDYAAAQTSMTGLGLNSDIDTRVMASSAVGTVAQQPQQTVSQEAQTSLSPVLGGTAKAQKFVKAAQFGTNDLNSTLDALNVRIVGVNPEAQRHLQNSFNAIRGAKKDRVNELQDTGGKAVEERMVGIAEVLGRQANGEKLGLIRNELREAQSAVNSGDIGAAAAKLNLPKIGNEDELKNQVNSRISHLETGIQHFDNLNRHFREISPELRGEAVKQQQTVLQTNPQAYLADIKQKMMRDVELSSHSTVAAELATQSLASNPNMTVGQMASPEGMETLAQAIEGMRHDLQASRGEPLTEIGKIDPQSLGLKQMVTDTLNTSIKEGVVDASTKMTNVLNNKAFQNNMANAMKRAMQTTTLQTTVKNIPKTPGETPSSTKSSEPPQKPVE